MDDIKIYPTVHAHNSLHEFRWTDMAALYQERNGAADAPHRHGYYTILVLRQAQGEHRLDFQAHPLGAYQVYFITPGQVHQLVEQAPSQGVALVFSQAFLTHTQLSPAFVDDLQLFRIQPYHEPLELEPDAFELVWSDVQRMGQHYHSTQKYRMQAIGALLQLVLLECQRHCDLPAEQAPQLEGAQGLVQQFRALAEAHHKEWHQVADYAQALHVTPDHLNRTIKQVLHQTAKHYLQDRLLTAAKRRLFFTSASTKEIGYELGFTEPANFSAFFKRCTGQSPTQFRAEQENTS